jgi:hypothetical protein
MSTFTFNGRLAATVTILGKPYTVVATTDMGQASSKLEMAYHAAFDDSAEVGTIAEIATDLANLAAGAIKLGGTVLTAANTSAADPSGPIGQLLAQAQSLPGFSGLLGAMPAPLRDARVRITDLALALTAPPGDPPSGQLPKIATGSLTVGVGLDFRNQAPANRTLLGVRLDTVTLLVKFDLAAS